MRILVLAGRVEGAEVEGAADRGDDLVQELEDGASLGDVLDCCHGFVSQGFTY